MRLSGAKSAAAPATVSGEFDRHRPLGPRPGRRRWASTREPGDLPSRHVQPRAGCPESAAAEALRAVSGRRRIGRSASPPVSPSLRRAAMARATTVTATCRKRRRRPAAGCRPASALAMLLGLFIVGMAGFSHPERPQRRARHAALERLSLSLRGAAAWHLSLHRLLGRPGRPDRRPRRHVAQQFGTVPLILQGEVYEKAAERRPRPASGGHIHGAGPEHAEEAWEPATASSATPIRRCSTFRLDRLRPVLRRARAVAAADRLARGLPVGARRLCRLLVAPTLGLPPELPGIPAAPLGPRQSGGSPTVAATAIASAHRLPAVAFGGGPRRGAPDRAAPGRRAPAREVETNVPGVAFAPVRRRRYPDDLLLGAARRAHGLLLPTLQRDRGGVERAGIGSVDPRNDDGI